MTQKVIKFGAEPLGIGGDTFGTGFQKCNDNFAELYAKTVSEQIHSNITTYENLAPFYASSTHTGALVIHLPAKFWKSNTLLRMRVMGYNFTETTGGWALDLAGQPAASKWVRTSATFTGVCPADQVRYAWAVDHAVIIIGTETTAWSYMHAVIERLQTSYSNRDGWETGIWMAIEPDIAVYTNIVNPFNAGATTLPLTGGTMTGKLTLDGGSSDMAITLTTTGNQNTAYYANNALHKGRFLSNFQGVLGIYSDTHSKFLVQMTADGTGLFAGNANTASKLATAYKINGVSFDGSKDVTSAMTLPYITGGGNEFYINSKNYVSGTAGVQFWMDSYRATLWSGKNKINVLYADLDAKAVTINGTLSTTGNVSLPTTACSWISGHKNASLSIADATSTGSFFPWIQQKTYGGGSWVAGVLGEDLYFNYATKADYDASKNNVTKSLILGPSQITVPVKIKADGGVVGNASTATKLASTVKVHGVDFDGSKDIELPTFSTTSGLVPARVGSTTTKYLREDGTWTAPPNTSYGAMSQTEANTGTATSNRTLTAKVLKAAIEKHAPVGGQFLGTATNKAIAYNAQTIAENITIPATYNGLSAGPITINAGFTVTIADGATWTIV